MSKPSPAIRFLTDSGFLSILSMIVKKKKCQIMEIATTPKTFWYINTINNFNQFCIFKVYLEIKVYSLVIRSKLWIDMH